MKVLMCVPNISEGRDLNAVERVVEAVRQTEGVRVLDYSSEPNHNRSVITYLGEPEAVLDATQAMSKIAFDLIDMTKHKGSHPRMGAVDVVPFIPVRNVSVEAAVEIARRFGKFVGELGVPVYYYEDAATRPERVSLADVRKGEYEALKQKLRDPTWQPDEGPAIFNPRAGALATGARFPLVAFNVNLRTDDLSVAQRMARAIRHINGGFRFVRAMGLTLEGQGLVQVSMNLTNYTKTPIPRVLETIRAEAARYGVSIVGTELVGPVPIGAIEEVVRYYLQAHDFCNEQVIETVLIE